MRFGIFMVGLLLFFAPSSFGFDPPNAEQRLKAVGPLTHLPLVLQRAFDPRSDFSPVPIPGAFDWLTQHAEAHQTFEDFEASDPNRPDHQRRILYFQPIGEFPTEKSPSLESLKEYAHLFFQMEVKMLPPVSIDEQSFSPRINPLTKKRQIFSAHVLRFLRADLPKDAFCVLAITMEDLYPDASWNFVFGEASLRHRVGVYSFARYDPTFYGETRTSDYRTVLLRRSCQILVHETGHMFGLLHCTFFHCVMNGANHLRESDLQPMHECPVCLRKLHSSLSFDVVQRYAALAKFYKENRLDEEADWVEKRLRKISETQKKE
jgi:archaemetzincin